MSKVLIFLPVSNEEAALIGSGRALEDERTAFWASPALRETFDIVGTDADAEELADLAAMQIASVAGLAAHGYRLVLTAKVDSQDLGPHEDGANGAVVVRLIRPNQVEAWFADEEPLADELAAAVRGRTLDEAWDRAAPDLLGHDLLWHSVVELPVSTHPSDV